MNDVTGGGTTIQEKKSDVSLEKLILNLIEELEHETSKDSAMYETVHTKIPHSLVEIEAGIADYIKTHILSELRVSAEKIRSKIKDCERRLDHRDYGTGEDSRLLAKIGVLEWVLKELVEPSSER